MSWNFDSSQYVEKDFSPLPVGDYRVRVKEAQRKTAQSGNEMIKLTLEVSGSARLLWNHIVFMKSDPAKTNQMLGAFFNSFGLTPDMNEQNWVGKVGACRVKHEAYNGEMQAKVAYFLPRKGQDKLPPWDETALAFGKSGITVEPDELPF